MTLRTLGTNAATLNATYVVEGSAFADLGKQSGVDNTGTTECGTALQAALTSFASLGVRAYARGTFKHSSTLTIAANADLGDATFNYTGTGTAVRVGTATSGTQVFDIKVRCPKVIAANKASTGWTEVAGTIGVDISNLYHSTVEVPLVRGFETGLRNYGKGTGNVYNTVTLGHLDDNKINQLLDADGTGWCNQNLYIGGRHSHNSNEGTNVSGTAQVKMTTTAPSLNNNLWLNCSLEGNAAEFHAVVAGSNNVLDSCRWEVTGGARVKWDSNAIGNEIRGGYQSASIVETFISGASKNAIRSSDFQKFTGSGVAAQTSGLLGGMILENTTSSVNPILAVMEAGARAGGTVTGTGYAWAVSAQKIRGKRAADAFDRLWLDAVNGRIYIGAGTADPTMFIGRSGSAISINSAHVDFVADNTFDLGETGAKPRYIRAGTAVQTGSGVTGSRPSASTAGAGAMWFDTTLGKPIWSTGSGWVDATGVSA